MGTDRNGLGALQWCCMVRASLCERKLHGGGLRRAVAACGVRWAAPGAAH